MKTRLDSFERQIEDAAGTFRPLARKRRQKIDGIIDRVRKSRRVNIQISKWVIRGH